MSRQLHNKAINNKRESDRESILKGPFENPESSEILEKIDFDDPLITSIQNVIDQKLGDVTLNDEY